MPAVWSKIRSLFAGAEARDVEHPRVEDTKPLRWLYVHPLLSKIRSLFAGSNLYLDVSVTRSLTAGPNDPSHRSKTRSLFAGTNKVVHLSKTRSLFAGSTAAPCPPPPAPGC